MRLAGSQVDIWLARDARLRDPALLEAFAGILSAEDRVRVERMHFPQGRHQQLVTRALLRRTLSNYLPDIHPASWRFEAGEFGRPAVARDMPEAARQLHFNIAHTVGLVVMAVARTPALGVDVERISSKVPLEVAHRYFSSQEIAALDALPDGEKPRRFQRLWTLKESYLKAVGTGLSGGLASMTFNFEREGLRFEHARDPDAMRWQFREFTVDEEHRMALACLPDDAGPLEVRLLDQFSGEEQRAQSQQRGEAHAVGEGGEDDAG